MARRVIGKSSIGSSDAVLSIRIQNTQPVDISDVANSQLALARQYQRFLESSYPEIKGNEPKLYLKGVRSASIGLDIVSLAPQLQFAWEHKSHIVAFTKYLKSIYDAFLGKKGASLEKSITEYNDCVQILSPIARDAASQINISAKEINLNFNFSMTSNDANAFENRIRNLSSLANVPEKGIHEQKLFYWYQARNKPKSSNIDRGVIEDISPKPIKVVFMSDDVKTEMIHGSLFQNAYLIDVDVQTIKGKPSLYKIRKVHDTFVR